MRLEDNIDLKYMKKNYGEDFAKFCRSAFPIILETEGLLTDIISSNFAPSKILYKDLELDEDVRNFFKSKIMRIYKKRINHEKEKPDSSKTGKELFEEAGYDLYECKTQEEILAFKKYYAKDEELCTFRDERLKKAYVFFAVRKDVDQIRREDFAKPRKNDAYSLSVLGIQFARGEGPNEISIISRYNHSVENPNATLWNNPDNIIPGLTKAFEREYRFDLNYKEIAVEGGWRLPNFIMANDGRLYCASVRIDDTYFCENNITIDEKGDVQQFDKSRFILMDGYLLDKETKKLFCDTFDGFVAMIGDISKIEEKNSIKEVKLQSVDALFAQKIKCVTITSENQTKTEIYLNEINQILGIINNDATKIREHFLRNNCALQFISCPNVKKIGDVFLPNNTDLIMTEFDSVKEIGDNFIEKNENLEKICLPNVKNIGNRFLPWNEHLTKIYLPKAEHIGKDFLYYNTDLPKISLPKVRSIDKGFMCHNEKIEKIKFPKVKTIKSAFMTRDQNLREVDLPKVKSIGYGFLYSTNVFKKISLNSVEKIEPKFLSFLADDLRKGKTEGIGDWMKIEVPEDFDISMIDESLHRLLSPIQKCEEKE